MALPELFAWSGPALEERAHAEDIPGPTTRRLGRLAAEHGIHLLGGSILEAADADHCYNSSVLFGPDGAILAVYRKIHLFDIEVVGQVVARESATRRPGDETICVPTALAHIGMSICYDLRFPELFRRLVDDGAELIVVPAAFTAVTGLAHWSSLLRARAIENQCFIVAPNQFGPSAHGFDNYGHSLIVDPWGTVLAEAGADDFDVLIANLDGTRLDEVRRSLPSLEHRRLK